MINRQVIIYGFLCLLIYVILFNGFMLFPLSSGDWWFYFKETLLDYSLLPSTWNNEFGMGLGSNQTFFMNINSYFTSTSSLLHNFLGIPWLLIERIFWFWPFLILSLTTSYYLFRSLFQDKLSVRFGLLASLLYLLNTYALMLIGGGQLGVAMAYAVAPLTIALFIKTFAGKNRQETVMKSILFGLALSVTVLFDIRIAYVVLFLCGLFGVIRLSVSGNLKSAVHIIVFSFAIPGTITILLHLWWVLPYIFSPQSPIGSLDIVYTSEESVKFFSFADFSHALSLLHPNWPENIFGKVSFLRPEFLLLPILAFSSLLFVNRKPKTENRNLYVLFFTFLALVGAFLAKGAREPFGFLYLWMFENIPGFIMFRDPTKWYTLVALSYAMLIPFSVSQIYEWLKSKQVFSIQNSVFRKFINLQNIFLCFLVFYFMFLLRPAWMGELGGTFKPSPVSQEYIQLKDFLHEDEQFSRTLWVPQKQRFGFTSSTHPGVSAQNFFDISSVSGVLDVMNRPETQTRLQDAAVRYVIVPYDVKGEIFLTDRKYDDEEYTKTVTGLDSITWLRNSQTFGDIVVYELSDPKDHFFTIGGGDVASWERISATEYTVTVTPETEVLVFSEGYDPGWVVYVNDHQEISSKPYSGILNSFELPTDAGGITVYYIPQRYVLPGLMVSGSMLVTVLGVLIYLRRSSRGK